MLLHSSFHGYTDELFVRSVKKNKGNRITARGKNRYKTVNKGMFYVSLSVSVCASEREQASERERERRGEEERR